MKPIYEPVSVAKPYGAMLTFYGTLRGRLRDVEMALGMTPLVHLKVDVGITSPPANRMLRDLYWAWYFENKLPLQPVIGAERVG